MATQEEVKFDPIVLPDHPPQYSAVTGPPPQQQAPITMQPHHLPMQQQPMHSTNVVVVQQQPRVTVVGPRQWSSGLCACCDDMGSCLAGTFCFSCFLCHLANKMGESCCLPVCSLHPAMVGMRTKIRIQNNISGDINNDIWTTCCCPMCAACQMSREVDFVNSVNAHRAAMNAPI
ncbi:PLAC8 [Branchiostoma lanceolatum]|uniref:PLAC8 protein n=1 Tax=Branchiostoma lanceolatum TaxID=7740 RepID=A0A8K0ELU9_BRALA|nr:PLAC8 [Branchiostoma lanceolatum]